MTSKTALPTLAEAFTWGVNNIRSTSPTPTLDARVLLSHTLNVTPAYLVTHSHQHLTPDDWTTFQSFIHRRINHEPVARICGQREFYGLTFHISPATLDPRPATEILVTMALSILKNKTNARVLDLGTGSGCILLSVMGHAPKNSIAYGLGIDQSKDALDMARTNASYLGIKADFRQSDWFSGVDGTFDIILSNPPYIPSDDIAGLDPDVRLYDPRSALDGGPDGLRAYAHILGHASHALAPGGHILVEIGSGQDHDVTAIAHKSGLMPGPQGRDLEDIIRCLSFQWRYDRMTPE